jgi:hypothetical protein
MSENNKNPQAYCGFFYDDCFSVDITTKAARPQQAILCTKNAICMVIVLVWYLFVIFMCFVGCALFYFAA